MRDYRLLIDAEVVDYLRSLKRRDQDSLLARLREIGEYPGKFSDYIESDAAGRRIDVHVFGRHAVKFWDDFADRHVKILDVHPSDRTRSS